MPFSRPCAGINKGGLAGAPASAGILTTLQQSWGQAAYVSATKSVYWGFGISGGAGFSKYPVGGNPTSNAIVGSNTPYGVVYDPAAKLLYFGDEVSLRISKLNPLTEAVVGTFVPPALITKLFYIPTTGEIYCLSDINAYAAGANVPVYVLNPATGVFTTINLFTAPAGGVPASSIGGCYSPVTNEFHVSIGISNTVGYLFAINAATKAVTLIGGASNAHPMVEMVYSDISQKIYGVFEGAGNSAALVAFNPVNDTFTGDVVVPSASYRSIGYNPVNGFVYILDTAGLVSFIQSASDTISTTKGRGPALTTFVGMAFDPDDKLMIMGSVTTGGAVFG